MKALPTEFKWCFLFPGAKGADNAHVFPVDPLGHGLAAWTLLYPHGLHHVVPGDLGLELFLFIVSKNSVPPHVHIAPLLTAVDWWGVAANVRAQKPVSSSI